MRKRLVSLLSLFLLLLTCIPLLGGCARLPRPEDTDLEFWIAQKVEEDDFDGYVERYGLFGGREYYGQGYLPTEDEHGQQVDPEHCVIYTVTAYPDYISSATHVTRIVITDPSVRVYGITLRSTPEEFQRRMEEEGFAIEQLTDTVLRAAKGKFHIIFSPFSIQINVDVTNLTGIEF